MSVRLRQPPAGLSAAGLGGRLQLVLQAGLARQVREAEVDVSLSEAKSMGYDWRDPNMPEEERELHALNTRMTRFKEAAQMHFAVKRDELNARAEAVLEEIDYLIKEGLAYLPTIKSFFCEKIKFLRQLRREQMQKGGDWADRWSGFSTNEFFEVQFKDEGKPCKIRK
jgi:hypothetical protein